MVWRETVVSDFVFTQIYLSCLHVMSHFFLPRMLEKARLTNGCQDERDGLCLCRLECAGPSFIVWHLSKSELHTPSFYLPFCYHWSQLNNATYLVWGTYKHSTIIPPQSCSNVIRVRSCRLPSATCSTILGIQNTTGKHAHSLFKVRNADGLNVSPR